MPKTLKENTSTYYKTKQQMKHPNIQQQLDELQEQNRLMRQLATPVGFYQYFFKQLPQHRTQVECFNTVNDLYFDLFGEYRYSSYYSFAQSHLWKKKKNR